MKAIVVVLLTLVLNSAFAAAPIYELDKGLKPIKIMERCKQYQESYQFVSKLWQLPLGEKQVDSFNRAINKYGEVGFSLSQILRHSSKKNGKSKYKVFIFQRPVRVCGDS